MAKSKFIVTAALKLVPDASNLAGLTKAINKALKQVPKNTNINLNLKLNKGQLRDVERQLANVTKNFDVKLVQNFGKSINQASKETKVLGHDLAALGAQAALATRRFGGFVIGTFAIRELGFAFKETFKDALEFQESLVKVGQVTKTSLKDLSTLEKTISKISTGLGVDSEALISASQTLSQAGLSLKDTETALSALAKTTLSPSFGDLKDTTEGLISAMAQFKIQASGAEGVLSSINAIAAKTAVESEDLIDVIKRTGGAFQATGGDLNELLALFTSVRATTRESAGTIGTGFRTIFTRLQRPGTIDFLSSLGIELRDVNNQFIGGFEAVRKLSGALNSIPSTDPRFAQIVEELGGIRQVSKVIPLIKEFSKAEEALQIAMTGRDSIQQDVVRSQESMLRQFREIKEEFKEVVRQFANNQAIKQTISIFLELSRALLNVSESLVPILPIFAALGAKSGISGISKFLGGAGGKGGFLPTLIGRRFKDGGSVGGVGSGDTVPAMLEPGEFVLKKAIARKIGYGTLNAINDGVVKKFRTGGLVEKFSGTAGTIGGAAVAVSLINIFSGLSDSVQEVTGTLLALGAQILLFKKVLDVKQTSSPILGTREVKLDRILSKDTTSLATLREKDKSDRRQIELRKESIGNLSGFLNQTDREGQRRTDEIRFHNEDIVKNTLKLTSEIANIDNELSQDSDREKNARIRVRNEKQIVASRQKELAAIRKNIFNLEAEKSNALDPEANAIRFFNDNPQLRGVVPESFASRPNPKIVQRLQDQIDEQVQKSLELQKPIVSVADRQLVQRRDQLRQVRAALSKDLEITRNTPFLRELNDPLLAQRSGAQAAIRDLSDETSQLQSGLLTPQDIATRESRIKKVKRGRLLLRTKNIINNAAPFIGGAGVIGGDLLSRAGSTRIAAGNRSGVGLSAAGGALTGAGQGALLGSILGPIGTAVGAAGGAIIGFTSSLINAKKEIETVKFSSSMKKLQEDIGSVLSGRSSAAGAAGGIASRLGGIRQRLLTTTGDDFISAQGEADNISVPLSAFLDTLAKSSSTFEQFDTVGGDVIKAFADISGRTVKDLNKQYRDQIQAQQEGIKTQKLFNQASFEAGLQLRANLAFVEGLANNETDIKKFSDSVKSIAEVRSGRIGSLELGQVGSIKSAGFAPSISNLSGFFGPEASNIFSELSLASKALGVLPDILIDLRSNRLDSGGDIDLRLRRALSANLGVSVSNDVVNKIINTFREIGGEEGEPKFLQALESDFAGTIDKFDQSFNGTIEIVKQATSNIQVGLQEFATGLETAASLELQLAGMRRQSIDTVIEAEKTLAQVFEKDINFANLGRLSSLRNGPRGVAELSNTLSGSSRRATEIQTRLNAGQFSGFNEARELVRARQEELTASLKARDALEQLADTSNTTGTQLQELGKLREDQGAKRDFASSFIFGDSSQRRDIGLSIQAAVVAASENSLQNIPDFLRGQVLDVFKQFENTRLGAFGGRTGSEALKGVIAGTARENNLPPEFLQALGITPGNREQQLKESIVAGINTSMEAQRALQQDTLTTQQTLLQVTEIGFNNVVVGFRDAILEGQQTGLQSRLQQTQANIGTLQTQQQAFGELAKLGVTTPEQIRSLRDGVPQQANTIDQQISRLNVLKDTLLPTATKDQRLFSILTGNGDIVPPKISSAREQLKGLGIPEGEILRAEKIQLQRGGDASTRELDIFSTRITELENQRKGLDLRAFGGQAPNLPNIDKITQLLQVIGDAKLTDINSSLNTQGGVVGELKSQIDQIGALRETNQGLSQSLSNFNNNAGSLSQSLANFPSEVGHNVNGRVEVVINGAQVFQNLNPEISKLIEDKIASAINSFTRNNFPQLKPIGPNKAVRPRD